MNNYKKGNDGKFVSFAGWAEKECDNCHKKFKIKESSLKYGRGKCCSRKCVDENKKKTMLGKNNGMFGKTTSKEQRIKSAEGIRRAAKMPEYIENIKRKRIEYVNKHGYYPGQSPESKFKRKKTFDEMPIEKKKEYRKKSEETCLRLYGKTSIQIRQEALNLCKVTSIEKKIQSILEKHKIKFTPKYKISVGESYREYDFLIEDKKLLIEADGDFWHANPKFWNNKPLLEVQITNIKNDEFKNELAKQNGFSVIRFWEMDINMDTFENKLLDILNKYEIL